MKINVNVETTPQELRELFGLPNVQPMQEEMLKLMSDNMKKGLTGGDALKLMQLFFPTQIQSMEMMQKAFWEALAKTGGKINVSEKKPEAK